MKKVRYRRVYGLLAAVLDGMVLVRQASAELIGMIACARCAMGW